MFRWAFASEPPSSSHAAADEVVIRTVNEYFLTFSPFLHLQLVFSLQGVRLWGGCCFGHSKTCHDRSPGRPGCRR